MKNGVTGQHIDHNSDGGTAISDRLQLIPPSGRIFGCNYLQMTAVAQQESTVEKNAIQLKIYNMHVSSFIHCSICET